MDRYEALPSVGSRKPRFFYGYIIVLIALSIQMISWGMIDSYGIFFKSILTEFGWSRATISGAASLNILVSGLAGVIAGILSDRFGGPRLVMTACGFLFGLGYLLMSQLNAIWQLYFLYGIVVGIGLSATDVVLLSTIARWFVKKRSMMSGIMKVGAGIGIFIMPLVINKLIFTYDWRTSCIILGTLALVFITLTAQLLRRDPFQKGLLPDGEKTTIAASNNLTQEGLSLIAATHTRQFWMICSIYLITYFCSMTILTHITLHAIDIGISITNATAVLSIIGAASIVGRLVMGNVGDRIGSKQALTICFIILVAALSWLQLSKELWMLYLFSIVYGFPHGGCVTLISPMVAELFGTRSQGAILGTVVLSATIGGAIGPFLAGWLFDINRSYQLAFLLCTALSIIALMLASLLKQPAR